jgi:hypothetical protein
MIVGELDERNSGTPEGVFLLLPDVGYLSAGYPNKKSL